MSNRAHLPFHICRARIGSVDPESPIHCRLSDYLTNFEYLKVKIIAPAHELWQGCRAMCFEICIAALALESWLPNRRSGADSALFLNFDELKVKLLHRRMNWCWNAQQCVSKSPSVLLNWNRDSDSAIHCPFDDYSMNFDVILYIKIEIQIAHFLHFDQLLHAPYSEAHNKIQILKYSCFQHYGA